MAVKPHQSFGPEQLERYFADHVLEWEQPAASACESRMYVVNRVLCRAKTTGNSRTDAENLMSTVKQLRATFPGFFEQTVIRMRVYHNPWAERRLPVSAFGGEYDRHYKIDAQSKQFVRH